MKLSSLPYQLRLALGGRPLPLEKPTVIQFPVIDICNSRCQMCRIWENKKSTDITVQQLKEGLMSPLFSQVKGIGFNGGEPTLRDDLHELVNVAVTTLPRLTDVSLITNAFKYKQVIARIDEMGAIIKSHGLRFDVMVSLDGYGAVHDRVRGREGNFENAQHVINHVCNSDFVDNVRIGCTVIRENVLHLPPLLEYCIERDLYVKFRLGVPHQRLYTENLLDPYALTFEEKYEFVEFLEGLISYYEPSPQQRFFYRSLVDQVIHGKPRAAGCDWKHRGATITAKGELAYCAVQSKSLMANIAEGDPEAAYFGHEGHLKEIIQNKCDTCHHDYVGIPGRSDYQKLVLERVEARLQIKAKLKAAPGFGAIKSYRAAKAFQRQLEYYRNVSVPTEFSKNGKAVLICGWYGTETLGDKAILGGVIHAFQQRLGSDVQPVVVALNDYITQMTRRQMPELNRAIIVSPEQAVQVADKMDYVVFGGGPLMGINELAPMQAIFEAAKKAQVTTIVAGCGVGPLAEDCHNQSIKTILDLADVRLYRDQRSKDYAMQLGVRAEQDPVVEDPAFTWLAKVRDCHVPAGETSPSKVLLLGLRDFPYKEYARGMPEVQALAIKANYEQSVIEALKILVAQDPQLVIRPLPMCTNHFGSDDRWFYRDLFRPHKDIRAHIDDSLLGPEMAPVDYCTAFLAADALLAMRFHSLVFGLGLGVNSVALDYTLGKGKVRSLAEHFDVLLASMLDLTGESLAAQLQQALSSEKPCAIEASQLTFAPELQRKLGAIA